MLTAKLYISSKNTNIKIGQMINSIDNKIMIEKGLSENKIIDNFQSTNKLTWNESIHKALINRNL